MADIITPPPTITKEIVLAAYNAENGSTNLTFAELGRQLAINELHKFRRKMLQAAIVEEVII